MPSTLCGSSALGKMDQQHLSPMERNIKDIVNTFYTYSGVVNSRLTKKEFEQLALKELPHFMEMSNVLNDVYKKLEVSDNELSFEEFWAMLGKMGETYK